MSRRLLGAGLLLVVLGTATVAVGQRGWRRRGATPAERGDVPRWELDAEMGEDVFTFARLRYSSWRRSWHTDYPDADLNLSYRLQQLTSMKVHPDGKVLDISDPALFDHPFVYMVEPGGLELSDEEAQILRQYLLGGGFLMVDDFWGESEWEVFREQMKRVFPERDPVDLPLTHPVFRAVFELKEKPQLPSIHHWLYTGLTYEREDAREANYRAIFDDKGRMMVMICHNTDLGDGWEREGEDRRYFEQFSEKKAYPMGINIVIHSLTH